MPKRRVLAFGEYGRVASAVFNNLIAYLLFLRKCHAPAQSLLRLGPRSWVFSPAPAFPKSKLANVAVCPVRTAFGPLRYCMAFRGAGGTQEGSGCTPGGLYYLFISGDTQKYIFEGNTITFLIPRTALRGFFCHSNHTQEKLV
jgi:hypothetical protein